MNAITRIEPLDDIRTFLGQIPPEEFEQRRRIRTCRNAGSFKLTQTTCPDALALAWIVTETATRWIYAPATTEELEQVAKYLLALLACADSAEEIEAMT